MIPFIIERMNKLLEGYDNRIKQFVLKMAEKPIKLKKNINKNMTTREELYVSSSNKILDKKGFLFKSYKSDKERINELLKNKEIIDKCIDENKKNHIQKLKKIYCIQPSIHFKKRTGLEKIYDLFKKKHHLNNEQKILYDQLIKMGLIHSNFVKNENDDNYENYIQFENSSNNIFKNKNYNFNNNSFDEGKYKKFLHDKIINERKNMLIERKLLLNVGNRIKNIDKEKEKHLNNEETEKLYFKAAQNLTIFKSTSINHKLFKTWSMEDLVKQQNINEAKKRFYKTISSKFSKSMKEKKKCKYKNKKGIIVGLQNIKINDTENNNNIVDIKNNNNKNSKINLTKYNEFEKRKSDFNLLNEETILENIELKKEIININPLLFKLNYNKVKNDIYDINSCNNNNNKISFFSLDKLKVLKKMAFENVYEQSNIAKIKDGLNSYYNDYKKDENILIDGKFYKKKDADIIAEKMLKKCNYNPKNVNYKNIDGKGKLMFTNGLTVKEFGIKYGILP